MCLVAPQVHDYLGRKLTGLCRDFQKNTAGGSARRSLQVASPPILESYPAPRLAAQQDGWAPTFWMSVMSTSLITLFLFEEPDLELSKHR